MFGCRARPATPQKNPTTFNSYCPKHYPRRSDHYLISTSWCPSIECICHGLHGDFIYTHSHTDGQDFGSGQAYCLGQIKAESILCSEFKQGHLCLTVKGILSQHWWLHQSLLKNGHQAVVLLISWNSKWVFCVSFSGKLFMWHLKLIFPQSSTEFSQRRWVT